MLLGEYFKCLNATFVFVLIFFYQCHIATKQADQYSSTAGTCVLSSLLRDITGDRLLIYVKVACSKDKLTTASRYCKGSSVTSGSLR